MGKARAAGLAAGVALAVAVTGGTAACESGADGPGAPAADFSAAAGGTLRAWAFDNADDVGTARLDYAAARLPGLTVETDRTGFDAQKFTTRLAGGDVPDVVQMDREYVGTYAAQGLIMPVDRCFAAHRVDPRQRWYPNVVADVTYRDRIWAVPQFYQPPAIILNRTVLDAAGVRAEEIDTSKPDTLLAAIARMYRASDGVPSTLGFNPQATGQLYLWFVGQGGRLVGDGGVPTLDDPANVYPLELLKRIVDAQGGFARYKSFTDSFDVFGEHNQFVRNQVGAEIDAQWYANVLSPAKDRVRLAAAPFRGRDGRPVAVAFGGSFVIPAKSKNPSAACRWALALTEDGAWQAAARARAATRAKDRAVYTGLFTGSPGPDRSIREQYVKPSGNAGFDQVVRTYYDVLAAGRSAGASPAGQPLKQELTSAVTAALLGQKSPRAALADAQTAAVAAYRTIAG
ncbi:ABC transporter substrate-binding protein [Actinoplanes teichomyceticus]|uniref:Carbohydrate ABC transporter substrate-binding protein (CUT1 family) n=1 Tax=Actinoplanes teichomyceticus TaxID=1867 RepID=A0A561VCP1_ACTTI|nr:extracellular solute-binding protein [Actinoplanes teichomyceticus]TWG09378.1 carbohydrate ABC transporter substrate-binding protein (CUT1 family) [Actinoplanes teichomyceticus]GIF17039.1 sugar ABC transporter substrate-binding protein [Actinoplanes teichomyceticus]